MRRDRGQDRIFRPAFAAVSLGLLHGSQPEVFVVCHQPGRISINAPKNYPLPSLADTIDLTLRLGRVTNPAIRCGGINLNTGIWMRPNGMACCRMRRDRRVPAADPVRFGEAVDSLAASCLGAG